MDYCINAATTAAPTSGSGPPTLTDFGWTATGLSLCQGDCDTDSDCNGGLVCYHRDDSSPVPGCSGTGVDQMDYCITAATTKVPAATPSGSGLPALTDFGWTATGLSLCQGDCDYDSDC